MLEADDKAQLVAPADLDLQMIDFATGTMRVELQGKEAAAVLYYEQDCGR